MKIDENSILGDFPQFEMPLSVFDGIQQHVCFRKVPNSFVLSVLSNDLREATGRATDEQLFALRDIVRFCYCEIPGTSWGSYSNTQEWLAEKTQCSFHDDRPHPKCLACQRVSRKAS